MSLRRGRIRCIREEEGQSLIETALLLPLMLTLVFNAVNIGYFFYVALNLTTAPRQGAEYSIQGMSSAVEMELPDADPVQSLVNEGITGAISSAANTPMQVCSLSSGAVGSGSSQISMCKQYNGYPATSPDADPEAPAMVLNRIDIQYSVSPLISGRAFNLVSPSSLTFHRQVTMRAMP